jgi:hypothetical protein
LIKADFDTQTWRNFKEYCELEITNLRMRNDSNSLTEKESAYLRGMINQLKAILKLDEPKPGQSRRTDHNLDD